MLLAVLTLFTGFYIGTIAAIETDLSRNLHEDGPNGVNHNDRVNNILPAGDISNSLLGGDGKGYTHREFDMVRLEIAPDERKEMWM